MQVEITCNRGALPIRALVPDPIIERDAGRAIGQIRASSADSVDTQAGRGGQLGFRGRLAQLGAQLHFGTADHAIPRFGLVIEATQDVGFARGIVIQRFCNRTHEGTVERPQGRQEVLRTFNDVGDLTAPTGSRVASQVAGQVPFREVLLEVIDDSALHLPNRHIRVGIEGVGLAHDAPASTEPQRQILAGHLIGFGLGKNLDIKVVTGRRQSHLLQQRNSVLGLQAELQRVGFGLFNFPDGCIEAGAQLPFGFHHAQTKALAVVKR